MSKDIPDHWFLSQHQPEPDRYSFDEEEMRHATKVLRLREADRLQWLDGKGGRFTGSIVQIDRHGMQARVSTSSFDALPARLELLIGALHDATRLEWLCEKATELGATHITIVETQRSQVRKLRLERLIGKTRSALKQSARSWMPLLQLVDFEEALTPEAGSAAKWIAHCDASQPRIALQKALDQWDGASGIQLFIGPEGDFSSERNCGGYG
jgi:RNA methyltransferase, RsmE family